MTTDLWSHATPTAPLSVRCPHYSDPSGFVPETGRKLCRGYRRLRPLTSSEAFPWSYGCQPPLRGGGASVLARWSSCSGRQCSQGSCVVWREGWCGGQPEGGNETFALWNDAWVHPPPTVLLVWGAESQMGITCRALRYRHQPPAHPPMTSPVLPMGLPPNYHH